MCVCVCVCTAYIGVCHAVMVISVTQMGIGRELGLCCIMIRGDCYCVDDELGFFLPDVLMEGLVLQVACGDMRTE